LFDLDRVVFDAGSHLTLFLEGGPWEFSYRFKNNTLTKTSTTSQYIFKANDTGIMEFLWVKNMFCNATSTGYYHIHPLPTAALMNGRDIKASVAEGDSVDIILDLYGEPPCKSLFSLSSLFQRFSSY